MRKSWSDLVIELRGYFVTAAVSAALATAGLLGTEVVRDDITDCAAVSAWLADEDPNPSLDKKTLTELNRYATIRFKDCTR